jgi:hypothetical protein
VAAPAAAEDGDRARDHPHRGAALTRKGPFGLDPSRTIDVGREEAKRQRWRPVLFALGLLVVGALAGLTVAAFLSGARGPAAVFGLATLVAAALSLAWRRFRRSY